MRPEAAGPPGRVNPSPIPVTPAGARPRLDSLDLLRGAIMVLMALDHARDYLSAAVLLFEPTDLARTTPAIFLTRWITHFCAPVFFLLAGTGAYLSRGRGRTTNEVAWFLGTRGLWLVVLELTLVHLGWMFRFDPQNLAGQVIWALGWSMVIMAGLVYLPLPAIALFGLLLVAGHNLFDGLGAGAFGSLGWLWQILHEGGPIPLGSWGLLFIAYPLVPWVGVMAAGYALGPVFQRDRVARRRTLLQLGLLLTVAFVLLRASNLYGDPRPWTSQKDWIFTLFSFLDCAKYPPSLLYLLMTLGPALLFLAFFDGAQGRWTRPFIIFGRVPLFFYLLHLPLIHGLALLLSLMRHGHAAGLLQTPPFWGPEAAALYPPGYGYTLPIVYACWIGVVLLLLPLCQWFAALKQRRRDAWLSYF